MSAKQYRHLIAAERLEAKAVQLRDAAAKRLVAALIDKHLNFAGV